MMAGSCSGFQEAGADAGGVKLGMLIPRLLDDVCGHRRLGGAGGAVIRTPESVSGCHRWWARRINSQAPASCVQALVRVVLGVASLSLDLQMLCMNASCGRWGKLIPRAPDNALRQCW